ncbi:MAG: hypothetical protein M3394_09280 [Actinomycetota bacterium]|nr:hypothetical protein [Actinomycetota bacterium]
MALRMQSQADTAWAWAVLDHDGRVVVLAHGEGAWAEAQEWASRGYRVTDVQLPD